MMMVATHFSETSVLATATLRIIPEDAILHRRSGEKLKSYMKNGVFWDGTPCGSCKNDAV
jgi:hypothetical protein